MAKKKPSGDDIRKRAEKLARKAYGSKYGRGGGAPGSSGLEGLTPAVAAAAAAKRPTQGGQFSQQWNQVSGVPERIAEAQAQAKQQAAQAAERARLIREGVSRNTATIQARAATLAQKAFGANPSQGRSNTGGDWNPALAAGVAGQTATETQLGQKIGGRPTTVKKDGKWVRDHDASFTNFLERKGTSPLTRENTRAAMGQRGEVGFDDATALLDEGNGIATTTVKTMEDEQNLANFYAQAGETREAGLKTAAKTARKELIAYLNKVQKAALKEGKHGEASRTAQLIQQIRTAPNKRNPSKGGFTNLQVMALAYGSDDKDLAVAGKRGILGKVARAENKMALGNANSYSDLWSMQNFNPTPLVRAFAGMGFQVTQYLPGGQILTGLGVTPAGITGTQRPSLLTTGLMAPFQTSLTALSSGLMLGANAGLNFGYAYLGGGPIPKDLDTALTKGPRKPFEGVENPLSVYGKQSAGLTPGQVLQAFHQYTNKDTPGLIKSFTGEGGVGNITYDFVVSNVDPLSFALVGLGKAAGAARSAPARAGREGIEQGAKDIAARTGAKVPKGLVQKDGGINPAKLAQLQDNVAAGVGLGVPRAISDYGVRSMLLQGAEQTRGAWMQGKVGIAILDDIAAKAVKAPDVATLRKLLGNETSADAVFAIHTAARKGGVEAAREVANKLILSGAISPQVSLVNQFALKVLGSNGKLPGIGIELARPSAGMWGGKITTTIGQTMDDWARGKAPLAVIEARTARQAGRQAVELAALVNKEGSGNLVARLRSALPDETEALIPRLKALDEAAAAINTPALHGLVDSIHALVAEGVTGARLWEELAHIEAVAKLLDGAAGPDAARVVADQIERMWVGTTKGRPLLSAIREAAERVTRGQGRPNPLGSSRDDYIKQYRALEQAGTPAPTLSPLEQAAKDAAEAAAPTKYYTPPKTRTPGTVTLYRGENASGRSLGTLWHDNPKYAKGFGTVHAVDVPKSVADEAVRAAKASADPLASGTHVLPTQWADQGLPLAPKTAPVTKGATASGVDPGIIWDTAQRDVSRSVAGEWWEPDLYKGVDYAQIVPVIGNLPEGPLKVALADALAVATTPEQLRHIAAAADLAANPNTFKIAERLFSGNADRALARDAATTLVDAAPNVGKIRQIIGKAGLALKGGQESLPFKEFRYYVTASGEVNIERLIQHVDQLSRAVHLDPISRAQFIDRVRTAAPGGPKAAFEVVRGIVRQNFLELGAGKLGTGWLEMADAWMDDFMKEGLEVVGRGGPTTLFGITTDPITGQIIKHTDHPMALSQEAQVLRSPTHTEIAEGLREMLASAGGKWAKIRVTVTDAAIHIGDQTILSTAGAKAVRDKIHQFWKVMVVTRLWAPFMVGATVLSYGISHDDDAGTILKNTAIGFAAGGFGGIARFFMRVQLQDKMTALMTHGFGAEDSIPGVSRMLSLTGQIDNSFNTTNMLVPSMAEASSLKRRWWQTVGEWEDVGLSTSKRSINAWERIVNKVISPEHDVVAEILLHARAGVISDEAAAYSIKAFLAGPDGRAWKIRAKYAGVTVETTKELIDNSVPRQIARLRIDGMVDPKMLRAAIDEGLDGLPTHVPSQRLRVPGPVSWYRSLATKATAEMSTKGGVRTSWFNAELRQQERRLLSFGYSDEAAKEAAGAIAKRKMDEFFQFEQFSRFSAKADWVAPFMGPQQFDMKTWGRLVVENPGRVVRVAKTAGLAFNAGSELGIFTQDPTSGQWMLSNPASGWMSRHLFGGFSSDMPLTSFLAMTSGGFGIDGGMTPQLGGPWVDVGLRALYEVAPDLFDPTSENRIPDGLRDWLTPFSGQGGKPSTGFIPRQITLMTMALTGGQAPPWAFGDGAEQESEYNKWFNNVTRDLIAEHRRKHPTDLDWFPSKDEIQGRLTGFFTAWSAISSFIPSSFKPISVGKSTFEAVKNAWTLNGLLEFDIGKFATQFPTLSSYTLKGTTELDPDNMQQWQTDFTHNPKEYLSVRRQLTPKEFKAQFALARRQGKIWEDYRNIQQIKNSTEREIALEQWRDEYPEMRQYFRNKYLRDQEFYYIQATYPHGEDRERALNRWRKDYADKGKSSISFTKMRQLESDFRSGKLSFQYSPWKLARSGDEVAREIEKQLGGIAIKGKATVSEAELAAVKRLSPSEQLNYWNSRKANLEENALSLDSETAMDLWNAIGTQYSGHKGDIYKEYPWMTRVYGETKYESWVSDIHQNERDLLSPLYAEISSNKAAIESLKNPTGSQYKWQKGTYANRNALYAKQTELYAAIKAIKNSFYKKFPEMGDAMEDLQAILVYSQSGADTSKLAMRLLQNTVHGFDWIPSNDEASLSYLPKNIRQQKQADLARQLTLPAMEKRADGTVGAPTGKLLWEWLTDQQQDMLTRMYPHDVVEGWKAVTKEVQDALYKSLKGSGGGYSNYYRSGGYGNSYDELGFAFSIMKQYDRRNGLAKPAAYAEYLALPKSPGVRNEFLKKHPEVAEYIKLGPFANMPPIYQAIVTNIMIKNGRWEGVVETPEAITDLAFAREQLARWNRRGAMTKPAVLDVWLNMPTGPAKAQYIKDHPEIREWMAAGPMANMPDAYQEVVRDIMQRYGEWTAQQDPLGLVLQGYYNTPSYAKDKYLAAHPEIQAYWEAIRSPAEQQSRALVDQYYSIPDPQGRRAFVAAHPELQEYFLQARNKRYEQFADKVAQFLGQNPDYFERYLQEQTTILREMMQRFGTLPLVREGYKVGPAASKGRRRDQ